MATANETNIYKSLEDEITKLLTIVDNGEGDRFTGKYLKEKLEKSLQGYPLILHPSLTYQYEMTQKNVKELRKVCDALHL